MRHVHNYVGEMLTWKIYIVHVRIDVARYVHVHVHVHVHVLVHGKLCALVYIHVHVHVPLISLCTISLLCSLSTALRRSLV